ARLRVTPHADYVFWLAATPDGALVSLTRDGTITRTALDGTSVALAKGIVQSDLFAYAPARTLLAYGCDPDAVCLLDVVHGGVRPIRALHATQLQGIALSPDGQMLAVSSKAGAFQLFDLTAPGEPVERRHVQLDESGPPLFVADDEVALGTVPGVTLVRMTGAPRRYVVPDGSFWDADPVGHQLVLATTRGRASVVETGSLRVTAQIELCHELITGVKLVPGRGVVAYTCKDGTIGTWDLQRATLTVHGHGAGTPSLLTVSADGQYVAVSGGEAVIAIDLQSRLVTTDRGHRFPLATIAPALPGGAMFASADSRGNLRGWPLPGRIARVASDLRAQVAGAIYDDRIGAVLLTSPAPTLAQVSADGDAHSTTPRIPGNARMVRSDTGERFATYDSGGGLVELWSAATATRARIVDTHQGGVLDVALDDATGELITAGRDGRLLAWSTSDEPRVIARFDRAINGFVRSPGTQAIVANTVDGALWRVEPDGRVRPLRPAGVAVVSARAIPRSNEIAVGYQDGEVAMIDTLTWRTSALVRASESIRDIVVALDGKTIAIAANDGTIHLGARQGQDWIGPGVTWTVLHVAVRRLALTSDGLLVVMCNDGIVWLYATAERRWRCLSTGVTNLVFLAASADGQSAVVIDRDGRVVWLDLRLARKDWPRAPTTL
ncbi:MAG: WD40 repeat domain-containing protein, partial [Kofleriaceae bacterium]